MKTAKTVLFIDGENFQKKVQQAFKAQRLAWDDRRFGNLDLQALVAAAMPDVTIDSIRYYVAKLHVYPETREKSEELVALQRALKTNLEKQKVEFVMSGNVRLFKVNDDQLVFKEKGVDVRLAVDAVGMAADKKLKTAIICSSDSDMQPVVEELRRRKVRTVYLGFQVQPNRGLIFTCDETVLWRNNELAQHMPKQTAKAIKVRRFDEED
ncbi:MAG TPA: NYN domain-containing protein [Candidatus Saccharimonadales bacterium]|nr:NYN domain-containing protein [Candidatus Saccharimonadales bacterium]